LSTKPPHWDPKTASGLNVLRSLKAAKWLNALAQNMQRNKSILRQFANKWSTSARVDYLLIKNSKLGPARGVSLSQGRGFLTGVGRGQSLPETFPLGLTLNLIVAPDNGVLITDKGNQSSAYTQVAAIYIIISATLPLLDLNETYLAPVILTNMGMKEVGAIFMLYMCCVSLSGPRLPHRRPTRSIAPRAVSS